jgi:FtsZ-binding cell division protein ZapB
MIEIVLGSCLVVSIITIVVMTTKKTPIDDVLESNNKLKSEIEDFKSKNEDLKSKLEHSEKRRKNLLSINKGERALIPGYSLTYGGGTKDEVSFKSDYEVDVIEVTDKKIKVSPYRVITDNNDINSNQQRLQGLIDFLNNKWVDISSAQPIIDTQVRREDKLEELSDIIN